MTVPFQSNTFKDLLKGLRIFISILLLTHCLPYESNNAFIILGPDYNHNQSNNNNGNSGANNIKGWKEITEIPGKETIYSSLSAGLYETIAYDGPNSPQSGRVRAQSDGKGYNVSSVVLSHDRFEYIMFFRIDSPKLLLMHATATTIFNPYLVDANGNILEGPKNSIFYNHMIGSSAGGSCTIVSPDPTETKLDINKPEYENKRLSIVVSYEGLDGNTYYIKYPFQFTYTE